MQWWCSAQGVSWEWVWRPYPGVWLFVALLGGTYLALHRGGPRRASAVGIRRGAAGVGILLLWAALDWPVGALGAGYLASLHMVQYILISIVVPPLLIVGVPEHRWSAIAARPRVVSALRLLTGPILAVLVFDLTAVVTHVPSVVDTLMASQLGSFGLDMVWLLTALLFWWPVAAPVPARPAFPPPLQALYLFLGTVVHGAIAMGLIFSRYPVYATYELAPPTGWVSALGDQQIAGGLMMVVGNICIWIAIGIVFFRFMRPEPAGPAPLTAPTPTG